MPQNLRIMALAVLVCYPPVGRSLKSLYSRTLLTFATLATGNIPQSGPHLKRGRSLLARDEDVQESGLSLFGRGTTLRRKRPSSQGGPTPSGRTIVTTDEYEGWRCFRNIAPGPKNAWMIYCYLLTICIPPVLLRTFGAWLLLVSQRVLIKLLGRHQNS
jgi:hypothetical protein